MERIKFEVTIPKAVALAHGTGTFGEAVYEPTDAWLATLTPEARKRLGELLSTTGTRLYDFHRHYPVELTAPISEDSVRQALYVALLAADVAQLEREQEKAKAEQAMAERVSKLCALGFDDIFDSDGAIRKGVRGVSNHYDGLVVSSDVSCPEAEAHVKPFFARALARRSEIKAAAEAAKQAEKERATKLAESIECDARTWAAECSLLPGNIRRAAREGRSVRDAIEALVLRGLEGYLDAVFGRVGHIAVLGWRVETYGSEPRDDVPNEAAYALHDFLTTLIKTGEVATAIFNLPNAVVDLGPISRFEIAADGPAVWRTGVAVRATHPWLRDPLDPKDTDTIFAVVLAEPPEQDDEGDDE